MTGRGSPVTTMVAAQLPIGDPSSRVAGGSSGGRGPSTSRAPVGTTNPSSSGVPGPLEPGPSGTGAAGDAVTGSSADAHPAPAPATVATANSAAHAALLILT